MKDRLYELIMNVCFKIVGRNLTGRIPQVNDFLQGFRRKIEAMEIREGNLFIRTAMVDEFNSSIQNSSAILCSHRIRWTISDSEDGWAERKNNKIYPLIAENLGALEHTDKAQDLVAKVERFALQGERKTGIWPAEKMPTIST